jgi:hypothetical protein
MHNPDHITIDSGTRGDQGQRPKMDQTSAKDNTATTERGEEDGLAKFLRLNRTNSDGHILTSQKPPISRRTRHESIDDVNMDVRRDVSDDVRRDVDMDERRDVPGDVTRPKRAVQNAAPQIFRRLASTDEISGCMSPSRRHSLAATLDAVVEVKVRGKFIY